MFKEFSRKSCLNEVSEERMEVFWTYLFAALRALGFCETSEKPVKTRNLFMHQKRPAIQLDSSLTGCSPISRHWCLSTPPKNMAKPLVFCFLGWVNPRQTLSVKPENSILIYLQCHNDQLVAQ